MGGDRNHLTLRCPKCYDPIDRYEAQDCGLKFCPSCQLEIPGTIFHYHDPQEAWYEWYDWHNPLTASQAEPKIELRYPASSYDDDVVNGGNLDMSLDDSSAGFDSTVEYSVPTTEGQCIKCLKLVSYGLEYGEDLSCNCQEPAPMKIYDALVQNHLDAVGDHGDYIYPSDGACMDCINRYTDACPSLLQVVSDLEMIRPYDADLVDVISEGKMRSLGYVAQLRSMNAIPLHWCESYTDAVTAKEVQDDSISESLSME